MYCQLFIVGKYNLTKVQVIQKYRVGRVMNQDMHTPENMTARFYANAVNELYQFIHFNYFAIFFEAPSFRIVLLST